MNDQTQDVTQQQAPIQAAQAQPVQQGSVHSFTPQTPSGIGNKEHAPSPMREYASGAERVPDLPQPLIEAGVEHSPETQQEQQLAQIHQATRELSNQGQTALSATPVVPSNGLPYTQGEVNSIIERKEYTEGVFWKAVQVGKMLKGLFVKKEPEL